MIKLLVHNWQQMFIIPKPQIWQTVHRSGNAIKNACITTLPTRQTITPTGAAPPGSSTLSASPWVGLITNAALTPRFWQWKRSSTYPNCLLPRLCFQPSWAKTCGSVAAWERPPTSLSFLCRKYSYAGGRAQPRETTMDAWLPGWIIVVGSICG